MELTSKNNTDWKKQAKDLVLQMTLEEKAGLCSGRDCWTTKPIRRLGLDSITMMDGPHGLRKQIGEGDNLGIGDSLPSVCFPTASALACSFDRELLYQVGKAIGEECLQEKVAMILGPGVNQKRSPLCGRNFEYFSEDPLLSGELAVSMINGVQSTGVGASLKHFAVNNQEKRRMTVNAVVDERTLRETYLRAFEIAVKKGKPATVMCSYNRLNKVYCSENEYLLTDILRKEWGYEGAVVSDWGAVSSRVAGVAAGLDLEMPGNDGYNDKKLIKAVQENTLSLEILDQAACRVTELILKGMANKREDYHYDAQEHHRLAVRAAEQSAVLLKNVDHLLPGNLRQKAAVIGTFAREPRYQGAGSSKLHPVKVENAWEVLMELGVDAVYAKGYSEKTGYHRNKPEGGNMRKQEALIREACEAARGRDIVYLFAGLPEGYESEGFDRRDLSLPWEQDRLIEAVSDCNPNVVVILLGGAPMELPWINKVKSVLLGYLSGEGGGRALVNLLLGLSIPCGKLAETWPLRLTDTPAYSYFPGTGHNTEYRESIYVGYRYYEKAEKPVLFPFGHGLSYTDFQYSDLRLDRDKCQYGDKIKVSFCITNCGTVASKETAFLFAAQESKEVFLPKKELREFVKIELQPEESKEVSIALDTASFGYYNIKTRDWYAPEGVYKIIVGKSTAQEVLQTEVRILSPAIPQPDYRQIAPVYYQLPKGILKIEEKEFGALYGKELPVSKGKAARPYHVDNTLEDVRHTFIGKMINWYAGRIAGKVTQGSKEQQGMMSAMMKEMPFHSMVASGDGMISESMLEGILDLLNGHYIRGFKKLFK